MSNCISSNTCCSRMRERLFASMDAYVRTDTVVGAVAKRRDVPHCGPNADRYFLRYQL
eukprot:COSAG01_NODE_160_length_23692_cov_9.703599_21_plen_58_part_00